ncbi:hypothetical conserved protein [Oceanobacillus iheyensis HTE831]|uniref:Hypothetical conserved protein n=1 Tax=Oceanobacillus iheyensis (strain DSM 14371 / CIP 107618 / JCM 11309 / KCTC 3954 / HTE831) TaxID=221109 RepID=Q8EQG5_OCEIH|nr:VrrA/YqfQ family protein [Oceanobacillus iheyensis]BAC13691.1 hypothetical conserved protein [Oceanobacillus iheyensis HTE831]
MVFPPQERQRQQQLPFGPMHPHPQQNRNPFLNNNQMSGRNNSRGIAGLLSSFGGGKSVGGVGAASSGGLQTLSKTLGGVQQFLGILQSTAPLIQEYGPMVKNLPSMYRMMKAFKELSNEDEETSNNSLENTDHHAQEDILKTEDKSTGHFEDEQKDPNTNQSKPEEGKKSGLSTPKLFI